jgi:glycosyltransferase involved in cell wall biosynthesis
MKIVFLNRTLSHGGAERQLVTLATGLHQRGHEVIVSLFYPDAPLGVRLKDAGVPIHCFNKRGAWDLVFPARLIRFIRDVKPDVFYSFKTESNVLATIVRPFFGGRLVWGLRNAYADWNRFGRKTRLARDLERRLSWLADLIIANSHCGRRYAIDDGHPERIVVVPNGFDTERFAPDESARWRVREELGVGRGELLVGIVGRLHPVKDHSTFLRAAAHVANARDNVRFICIGSGSEPYTRELHLLADELGIAGRVIWAGARNDMPALYNTLDVLTMCSDSEGLPNVVGEAMACGVPCVVTDVGDAAAVVGDLGIVVNPGDPTALGFAMGEMLGRISNGQIDSRQIRVRIVDHYSLERLVETTESLLSSLLEKKRGAS